MSLYYGHSSKPIFPTQRDRLSYHFNYDSVIGNDYREPTFLRTGHPTSAIPGTMVSDDTEITIALHEFDNDSAISASFAVRYKLVAIMKDGTKREIELDNITNMNSKRVDNGDKRYFLVDYTFRVGDVMSNGVDIAVFLIAFKRTAGSVGGCESIMVVEVVF